MAIKITRDMIEHAERLIEEREARYGQEEKAVAKLTKMGIDITEIKIRSRQSFIDEAMKDTNPVS
ncbi:MAG: hypothetical protein JEY79_07230 [Pseudodesulfovibrio sp.]|nr:hypothetical protein [Pseudodesulfovibrio sp.]